MNQTAQFNELVSILDGMDRLKVGVTVRVRSMGYG